MIAGGIMHGIESERGGWSFRQAADSGNEALHLVDLISGR